MMRVRCLLLALTLPLFATTAQAEPARKRPKPLWHGYGLLPGYDQPPNSNDLASEFERLIEDAWGHFRA